MYKIETHLHTKYCSHCGRLDAGEIVRAYRDAGYHGLVVTDHYNRKTFGMLGASLDAPGDKLRPFLEGYARVREEGEKLGLRVYRGAEIRFDECENDYLLFGFPDALLAEPGKVFPMGIAAFAPVARAMGTVIVQAHPYRHDCTPAIACYLDGVEIFNGNPRHENHNDRAEEYARAFHLLSLSGSDCHQPEDIAGGGIVSKRLPENDGELAKLIRSGDYTLLGL